MNSKVFDYAKERYDWEHSRKNELNNIISIPLGLLSLIFGCIAYFFSNLPENNSLPLFILFWACLIISCFGFGFCIFLFYSHQTGYTYIYTANPKDFYDFEQTYIKNFNDANVPVNQDLINEKVDEILYTQYIESTNKNINNNEQKIKYYRFLIITIMVTIVFLLGSFICKMFLPNKLTEPLSVKTINPIEIKADEELSIKVSKPLKIETDKAIIINELKENENEQSTE
ncbi:hypothetical protein [uncultured Treponema sp.]|uniref:hypothetical protein n=1 Tax=uncultured Treponema sp. TaxID=162155 RepID=UPI0025CBD19E|nr:hypothetical protein [uncultured Treponema sp.]